MKLNEDRGSLVGGLVVQVLAVALQPQRHGGQAIGAGNAVLGASFFHPGHGQTQVLVVVGGGGNQRIQRRVVKAGPPVRADRCAGVGRRALHADGRAAHA